MPKRLILASASPRRKELLSLVGLPFEVEPSTVDENLVEPLKPEELARTLARDKASDVWFRHRSDVLVLGADTVVMTDREGLPAALGKPQDAEEARHMLTLLSGNTHTVYTGLALVYPDEGVHYGDYFADCKIFTEICDTQVQFRELTPAMIDAYIATGEPFDKAGAYGIQGYASAFVEAVYGDYFNVVGLPVQTVGRMLEKVGIEWWRGPDALAQV